MNKFRSRWYYADEADDVWMFECRSARAEARGRGLDWSRVTVERQVAAGLPPGYSRSGCRTQVLIEWFVE